MRQACLNVGRDPGSVQLVAVSKTHPAEMVDQVAMAGHSLFGENRVQEAREKIARVQQPGLQWHLIGPLQRNKVKWAVQLFQMIQSVDSVELAQEINRRMPEDRIMPVLLQVNVGGEKQKSGLHPVDLPKVAREVAQLPHLSLQGLMTVPPFTEDPQQSRPFFRTLAELARSTYAMAIPGVSMDTLSMGMSHDFEVAIEEGATLVRIGSSLFGRRDG
ncbi:MAG: YggS family pyridoxal phosphate-dependent enzyme [Magnetococcales bacterium]|nr:YggS family pyridoxal phosphate-dependent enzyme [Magnetococcales bacterium]MBF0420433.1 YggS family pyridoxal phosphate-dependent enzyme [Magnetococcales bacterium]